MMTDSSGLWSLTSSNSNSLAVGLSKPFARDSDEFAHQIASSLRRSNYHKILHSTEKIFVELVRFWIRQSDPVAPKPLVAAGLEIPGGENANSSDESDSAVLAAKNSKLARHEQSISGAEEVPMRESESDNTEIVPRLAGENCVILTAAKSQDSVHIGIEIVLTEDDGHTPVRPVVDVEEAITDSGYVELPTALSYQSEKIETVD